MKRRNFLGNLFAGSILVPTVFKGLKPKKKQSSIKGHRCEIYDNNQMVFYSDDAVVEIYQALNETTKRGETWRAFENGLRSWSVKGSFFSTGTPISDNIEFLMRFKKNGIKSYGKVVMAFDFPLKDAQPVYFQGTGALTST